LDRLLATTATSPKQPRVFLALAYDGGASSFRWHNYNGDRHLVELSGLAITWQTHDGENATYYLAFAADHTKSVAATLVRRLFGCHQLEVVCYDLQSVLRCLCADLELKVEGTHV